MTIKKSQAGYDHKSIMIKNMIMLDRKKIESAIKILLIKMRSEMNLQISEKVLREKIKLQNRKFPRKHRYIVEEENQKRRLQMWIQFNKENQKLLPDAVIKGI